MNINVKMTLKPPVSAIHSGNWVYKGRRLTNQIMIGLSMAALVFGLFWLCWILAVLLIKGGGAISLALITESTPDRKSVV